MNKTKNNFQINRFKEISDFINNPSYAISLRLFVGLLGIMFVLLGITFRKLPPMVPLYYSLPWGDDQLTRPEGLFIIPFSLVVIFIVNFLISFFLIKKDVFLIQLLFWTTTAVSFAGLISLVQIIFLIL